MANVVITGATGGIGVPTVKELDRRGHRVFAGVRDVARASKVFEGHKLVEPVLLEVTDPNGVRAAAADVAQRLGTQNLDAVVNNAGAIIEGPVELVDAAELARQFAVNVLGPATVIREFLPQLRASRGRIVNVGAPTAHLAVPLAAPISASKAALTSLNDALRLELAPFGIKVVLVEPGGTDTEIFDRAAEASARSRAAADPDLVRLYTPMIDAAARTAAAMSQSLASPDVVASTMVRAITTPRPRVRYRIGSQAKAAPVIAKLPTGVVDAVVARAAGINGVVPADA